MLLQTHWRGLAIGRSGPISGALRELGTRYASARLRCRRQRDISASEGVEITLPRDGTRN